MVKRSKEIKALVVPMENQCQPYDGLDYSVCDLIEASKSIKVEEVPLSLIYSRHSYKEFSNSDDAASFVQRVNACDLSKPIILAPDGLVLDGKHRLVKARIEGHKTIKIRQFEVMPKIGFIQRNS